MPALLVAAFEPFAGRRRNRALDAARRLVADSPSIAGTPVELTVLATAFASLPAAIAALLARDPAALLLVGESGAARTLLVERIALNLADASIADNAGDRPRATPLVDGGPLARAVTFDPVEAARAATAAGAPSSVSAHAGTFCCNAALYHALDQVAARPDGAAPPVAFVHVPAGFLHASDGRSARGLAAIARHLVELSRRRAYTASPTALALKAPNPVR